MKITNNSIQYSATDLVNFVQCNHLTSLDLKAIHKELKKPIYKTQFTQMLQEKGQEFEASFLKELESNGKQVERIVQHSLHAEEATLKAMQAGVDVIYQAYLKSDLFQGWADFLIKVDKPSNFGKWSYEVVDTKLAAETKANAIIQICLYSQILENYQGVLPEYMHIKKPSGDEPPFRVNDYISYLRLIQKRFYEFVKNPMETYPEPVSHCEVCTWWERCNEQRRNDDHLSFVAGLGKTHTNTLKENYVTSLEELATLSSPFPFKPSRGSVQTYNKLVHQASMQKASRDASAPFFEVLYSDENQGLWKLPEPTKDDIYFDLEGDPMVGDAGREYIFGWIYKGVYHIIWAETAEDEKKAFEDFMDFVWDKLRVNPKLHIYHYGPYENIALKRLMGKYGTKADQLDGILRGGKMVDLLQVVRHSIRAGVERYSLKDLEPYHCYTRTQDLKELSKEKRNYEYLLQTCRLEEATSVQKEIIKKYNEEDCASTESLHRWLEKLRAQKISESDWDIPRPAIQEIDPSEKQTAFQQQIQPLFEKLIEGVPIAISERNQEEQARYLLAHMLDWYPREMKSFWWEYYRLLSSSLDDLLDEKGAITYLSFEKDISETDSKAVLHQYSFPDQELDATKWGRVVTESGLAIGEVVFLDENAHKLVLKKSPKNIDIHPNAIIPSDIIPNDNKVKSILKLAAWVAQNGMQSELPEYNAARDLLMRLKPRLKQPINVSKSPLERLIKMANELDYGVLPVQGPPGAGKSFSASKMILNLIQSGKKVGITALSHKVISNLLEKINEDALSQKFEINIFQIVSKIPSKLPEWNIKTSMSEKTKAAAHVIAGTSFMWCKEEMENTVDYLVVDEAGQLSLIDTLAASASAKNLILMGDPQQLKQPIKGTHPEGTELSALEHILGDLETITEDRGILLDISYRMHPDICALDSDLFYEGKLQPAKGNERIKIQSSLIPKSGLYHMLTHHYGNVSSSQEEGELVKQIVAQLCDGNSFWTSKNGVTKSIEKQDIKIITPYNAQVGLLRHLLPDMEIGTVDKFQGQEASIVIFSMATSSSQEAPRGMDFLYNRNRFNVALSRAQGAFVIIAAKALWEPECTTPQQIRLANTFCRFLEVSQPVNL
jgi:predicted RecB family nuclease